MKQARVLVGSSVLLFGSHSACTFYTACPDNPNPNPPGMTMNGAGTDAGGALGAGGIGAGGIGAGGEESGGGGMGPEISTGGEAPMGEWVNETFNLSELESECGNVSYLSAKPTGDLLIVSIAQHGLFSKTSSGSEWERMGQGEGSAQIVNRGSVIQYDPDDPNVFWESGIYNAGGVYRTDDGGQTFIDLGLTHNDYVSIDFTDPERQTLLASGHEMPRLLRYSTDGGTTWEDIGQNIPEEARICSWPVVLDATTFLLGCGTFGGGTGGIFRSTDAGDSWERVSEHKIFPGPLLAADGSIYFAGEVTDGIMRSDDQGRTWLGPFGAGEIAGATPVELPGGRVAAVGQRRVLVSADRGAHWKVVTSELPFQPTGITYSAERRAFYAYHWTCESNIPDDAVMAYPFDYERN